MRPAPLAVVLCAVLTLTGAATGCKNVCQKFAEHLEDCRVEFCHQYPANPICEEDAVQDTPDRIDCPDEREAVYERLIQRDCAQLARQMGWEALNRVLE